MRDDKPENDQIEIIKKIIVKDEEEQKWLKE